MRLRHCLLLWICAIWLQLCISAPLGNSAPIADDPISKKILPITRVLSAVLVQKEICQNETSAVTIVGELINVDKTHLNQFLQLKVTNQSKHLSEVSTFIDKIPSVDAADAGKSLIGLGALAKLKKDEDKLSFEDSNSPKALLEDAGNLRKTLMAAGLDIETASIADIHKTLEEIERIDGADANADLSKLTALRGSVVQVEKSISLGLKKDYKTNYQAFFAFSDLEKDTDPYLKLSEAIIGVGNSYDDIVEVDSVIPVLIKQSATLRLAKPDLDKHQTYLTEAEKSLKSSALVVGSSATKSITAGLSNGVQDFKSIGNDIQSSSFQAISNGGDPMSIRSALEPISRTKTSLESAESQLKKLSYNPQLLKDFEDYQADFTNVVNASNHAAKNQNLEGTLDKLRPCVQMLKKDPNPPNFQKLNDIKDYVKDVIQKMNTFDSVMSDITTHNSFSTFGDDFNTLKAAIDLHTKDDIDADKIKKWDEIRNMKFAEKYQFIFTELEKLGNPFKFGTIQLSLDILEETITSAKTMDLENAVKCLPSEFPDIHSLIDSGQKIDILKSQKSKLAAVTPIVANAQKVQSAAKQAVAEMKKTKIESATKLICDLPKEFGQSLRPFVNGGALVADFLMIKNSEKSINTVAKPSPTVKVAAEAVPKANTVYNDDFRKQIVEVLNRVKNQLKTVASLPANSLNGIITILESLAKVKGYAPKNFQVMGQIAEELSQNSIQEVKTAAKDFEIVSNLDMDFASRTSSGPMNPNAIQSNIILMFPKDTDDKLKTLGLMIVGGLCGEMFLGIICVVILYFILKYRLKKWKSKPKKKGVKKGGKKISKKSKSTVKTKKGKGDKDKKSKSTEKSNDKKGKDEKDTKDKKSKSTEKGNDKKGKDVKDKKSKSTENASKKKGKDEKKVKSQKKTGKDDKKKSDKKGKKAAANSKAKAKIGSFFSTIPLKLKNVFSCCSRNQKERVINVVPSPMPTPLPPAHVVLHIEPEEESSKKEPVIPKAVIEARKNLQKLREHVIRCDREHRELTKSSNFPKKGPIQIPRSPPIEPAAVLPDNIILPSVTYDPTLNEQYDIGSDVDDIEPYSSYVLQLSTEEDEKKEEEAEEQKTQEDWPKEK